MIQIYSPLEGIFTPVFRGRIWSVSVPYAYVLFEWDTYLGSFIATNMGDKWVAASNIIRMTLTFWHQGFVPGFWNGKCGEVDKSKPPLGAWALLSHVEKYPDHLWIARLLIRYLEAWNDWWVQQRMVDLLIAPGSIRSNVGLSWHCEAHGPVYSAVCETGLDNSPLYDSASFIPSAGLLDYWDVGLSAIFVLDCQSIANLAKLLGLASLDEKMSLRAATTSLAINENLWNDEMGIYLNKKWTDKNWVDIDAKSGARPVAPTSFYPMLAKIPSPGQAVRMVQGYLANPSEFGVCAEFDYGMPSISRSSSASHDNRYWRGRTWGPMNFLVYVGLEQYDHLPEVSQAMTDLARQSKNTFLKEWVSHRRIMENYSSSSGDGCDVRDANPFYHWGALLGLISEMEASRVAMDTSHEYESVGPELTLAMPAWRTS
jgi:putative isomerase